MKCFQISSDVFVLSPSFDTLNSSLKKNVFKKERTFYLLYFEKTKRIKWNPCLLLHYSLASGFYRLLVFLFTLNWFPDVQESFTSVM